MVDQRRGSDVIAAAMVMLMCCFLVIHSQAAKISVGDAKGWYFNAVDWPKGKSFSAGDTLVFNYNPTYHNVVVVDKAGYESCVTPDGAKVYQTGKDEIELAKGDNYFICNFPGHCESAMKIAITAN